ncbi:hypothetical protein NQ176_g7172 [Zarea fungicola]|uniref:Uncharacterized protein n=1 Tax=Zarea fungicola TaxID=93591 RepID=A0ACC1MZZ1_9HYPO|nr:hypothetical protein NQ176_g7172 [Lecanicillium fungicola]
MQQTHASRNKKNAMTGGGRAWREDEATYLLRTRLQKMPYKHIAAHLNKTELACRLHYHQLSHGSSRRKRTASTSSGSDQSPVMTALTPSPHHERIAQRVTREAADKAAAHILKVAPEATAHPSTNRSLHLAGIAPHIILDAKKTTGLESRYLAAIASRLRDDNVRQAWGIMCRYFDGHCALERIALQEEMKRKEAWNLLTAMSEYLILAPYEN